MGIGSALDMSDNIAIIGLALYGKVNFTKNGCWEYQGFVEKNGYSKINIQGKKICGHRVSYVVFNGPIYKNMDICHSCDNRSCVNPKHLFQGTRRDNMLDAKNKNRLSPGEKHSLTTRGEKSGVNKLTELSIKEIRASELKPKELAKKHKVSVDNIRRVLNRDTWKHVEDLK